MELSTEDKIQALKLVSEKIIDTAYHNLLLDMRYIDVALARLKPKAVDVAKYNTKITTMEDDMKVEVIETVFDGNYVDYLGTNGVTLLYHPIEVAKRYQQHPNIVTHDITHLLLHCIFSHLFFKNSFLPYWNLACDIVVEQLISTFPALSVQSRDPRKKEVLDEISKVVDSFTPQNIMTYLQLKNCSPEEVDSLEETFFVDEHRYWEQEEPLEGGLEGTVNTMTLEQLDKLWKGVSRCVEMNLDSFYKEQGLASGALRKRLKQVNREPYDYSRFLKKFAELRETPKLNMDEFDYIFYTYGLEMYDNMPLIEPLEYKDSHVIHDFVIAIDTSGSTSGSVVEKFLTKTYNILKTAESFGKKFNLYIIQCDSEIQEVAHIVSQEELEDYIKNFMIKGMGGTDFRPVFGYVRKLMEEKRFQKLKGLIYFTDGYGTFPSERTPYDTAFVFVVPEDYEQVTVPPWAIKVLLTQDEIKEF